MRLLTGSEAALIAEVPGAGDRWKQVHFNLDVTRLFFNLVPGDSRSITLTRVSALGNPVSVANRTLVFAERNQNCKIEFDFPVTATYPSVGRPIVVVVEEDYLSYRYRALMPGDPGHSEMLALLHAGPSVGRGVRRRLVTLDEVDTYWPTSALRGSL